MQRQDLPLDEAGQGEPVESLLEEVERFLAEGPQDSFAALFKTIPTIHSSVFMVPPHQPDSLRIHDLQCKENAHHLQLMSTTVHKVAIEDEMGTGFGGEAKGVEEDQQVPKLAMDITKNAARLAGLDHCGIIFCQELLKAVQLPLLKQHAQGCFYLEDHLSLGQVAPEGSPAPHITGHRPSKNYLRWSRPPGSDFPVSDSDSLEA